MADRVTLNDALRDAFKPRTVTYALQPVYDDYRPDDVSFSWDGRPLNFRDPIFTPIFTAILGSANVTLFGSVTLASALSAIATTALTIGLQYALAPKPPKIEQISRNPLTQAIPYRFWGVGGPVRHAGAYMLWETSGDKIFSVQAMFGHRIEGYTQFYLNDDRVEFESDGFTVKGIGDRYKDRRVEIFQSIGLVPETAFPRIVNLLGAQGAWTVNHRGDGQASLGMLCRAPGQTDFSTRFPYGRPSLSAAAKLAWVWDFRDPTQDPDNPNTWAWSKNSVVILCWHECFNPFGSKRDFRKAILPVLDMWIEEANVCDEDVVRASGGTEKRYECGGIDSAENSPKSGTNAILASMDGWMCERGDGALLIVAGKFREKYCGLITDADLVGYSVQYDVLPEEEINRLIPRFNYPATDWTTTDTDFFEDTAVQLVTGRVLAQEMNLDFVLQWRQARRLALREWKRLRQKVRGSLDLRLTGINAVYLPWSRLQTPNMAPRLNGKVVANRKSTLALMKGGFQMVFTKMPDVPTDIDLWNPSVDEGAAPPVPVKVEGASIPKPTIDAVAAVASAGSVYLRVSIADLDRDDLGLTVEWRVQGQTSWKPERFPDAVRNDTDSPGDGLIVVNTGAVPNEQMVEVQARFTGADGSDGPVSDTAMVRSTVDPTAPGTPQAFQAPLSGSTVSPSARSANDNSRALVFKRGTTGQSFAAATLLGRYAVSPNQVISLTDTPGTGTWRYWCGAENGSGVASASPAGPIDRVVP